MCRAMGVGGALNAKGVGRLVLPEVRTCLGLYEGPIRMLSVVFLWPLTSDLFRFMC